MLGGRRNRHSGMARPGASAARIEGCGGGQGVDVGISLGKLTVASAAAWRANSDRAPQTVSGSGASTPSSSTCAERRLPDTPPNVNDRRPQRRSQVAERL